MDIMEAIFHLYLVSCLQSDITLPFCVPECFENNFSVLTHSLDWFGKFDSQTEETELCYLSADLIRNETDIVS